MRWLNVTPEVRPPFEGWQLAGVYVPCEGGPLALLRFDERKGGARIFARLDRGKHMVVDPLPATMRLSPADVSAIVEDVGAKISQGKYQQVSADEVTAA